MMPLAKLLFFLLRPLQMTPQFGPKFSTSGPLRHPYQRKTHHEIPHHQSTHLTLGSGDLSGMPTFYIVCTLQVCFLLQSEKKNYYFHLGNYDNLFPLESITPCLHQVKGQVLKPGTRWSCHDHWLNFEVVQKYIYRETHLQRKQIQQSV